MAAAAAVSRLARRAAPRPPPSPPPTTAAVSKRKRLLLLHRSRPISAPPPPSSSYAAPDAGSAASLIALGTSTSSRGRGLGLGPASDAATAAAESAAEAAAAAVSAVSASSSSLPRATAAASAAAAKMLRSASETCEGIILGVPHRRPPPDRVEVSDGASSASHPSFPTVSASLLGSTGVDDASASATIELRPNSSVPAKFETDLFAGEATLLLRPPPRRRDGPLRRRCSALYDGVFEGDGDREAKQMEVQVRGRFKRVPRGTVYMGIELPDAEDVRGNMFRSRVTEGLSMLFLRVVRAAAPSVHYSFGSRTERPHIVAPMLHALDAVMVTEDGDEPTHRLGRPIDCDRCNVGVGNDERQPWAPGSTYTLAFSSTNVDLPGWRLVNLPRWSPEREACLRRFWGDDARSVRLVAYEVPDVDDDGGGGRGGEHRIDDVRYVFCAEVRSTGEENTLRLNNGRVNMY